jgi:hypothetical protein
MTRWLVFIAGGIALALIAVVLTQRAPLGSETQILLMLGSALLVGAGAVPMMIRSPSIALRNIAVWLLLALAAAGLYLVLYGGRSS